MLEKLLEKRKAFLTRTIERCSNWLKTAPVGSLRLSCRKNGKPSYYHKLPKPDKEKRLSLEKDKVLIRNLVLKDYYSKIIPVAASELAFVESLLNMKKDQTLAKVYDELHTVRKTIISPIEVTKEKALSDWYKLRDVPNQEPKQGNYYIPTERGELVRSKAEYKIANALFKAGIPYKYEFPYKTRSGLILHPDFSVRNKNTGEFFFWEHFGMMDDPKYLKNQFMFKIDQYAKDGILIGKELIATFGELNEEIIEETIKQFLL